ncbi:SMI1/KNR4 family protein [Massilia rubra]|uniref:SMI1/KNR4 family protein n=1 Tax=Massilia rubra TaxID=2607910 RepID=A0ABX0LIT0_9BURK|nr:SMI1/KNR4 family protein [Massilia rubra]NHZ32461.1 SMI1/KNR4 family protein [Massilia rubra]
MNIKHHIARLGGIKPACGDEFLPMPEFDITELEKMLNIRLPDDYRVFLATYGASLFKGESDEKPYVVFSSVEQLPAHVTGDGFALLDASYGANGEGAYSLATRVGFFRGRMPESVIPIADDGGAGQICSGVSDGDEGRIFYWDMRHEALSEEEYLEDYGEPRPAQAMYENMYLVAGSFDQFLYALRKKHSTNAATYPSLQRHGDES